MKTGIILANTGTPDSPTPDAVEHYLRQFLKHDRIRPMPLLFWNIILEKSILPSRKAASAEKYSRIWTEQGSPLSVIQESLASKLQRSLAEKGIDAKVLSAMSFGEPSIEKALSELEGCKCESLVVLPLYPQYAYSNAGIVEYDISKQIASHALARDATIVKDYCRHDAYTEAIAESIGKSGFDADAGDFLVISFHSVPRVDIANGDTYEFMTKESTSALIERLHLPSGRYAMCYQSRFDKDRKWLDPFLGPTLDKAASDPNNRRVFVVTPGFAIDCLETLYEIGSESKTRFLKAREDAGLDSDAETFVYVPCLNDTDLHVRVCETAIMPYLE